ncbi:3,4-dihydroxy 2-butanone 4-phosphate synthase [Sporothrix brasiliensis 5110]|uniref:3,4-dihydroxy-2-butanone 4-phosphate synthase n=1 Tax=Sporothrix brasiliensis 5110 TaxID=1398154 RepID=A0A0C2IME2_9PEZI|nr:3,4-dihydroxy 2-butanone 4-phosphate synthase [Sporothrix brasiliensis 5110]KIH88190.1 3,4-dihydroxy 2-butanone 4-phosphate synthase [Sporothrix brasiliensis 5110]
MPGSTLEGFNSIPETIEAFHVRREDVGELLRWILLTVPDPPAGDGQFIVVMDDPGRENEGDLIVAAENVSTEQMAFLIRHSSGIICAPILPTRADRLALPPMVPNNEDPRGTAYTLTIDASDAVVSTGISAHDRALTCRRLAQDDAELEAVVAAEAQKANGSTNGNGHAAAPISAAAAFRRPGHVLPLRARHGGVRERSGHTEAAIDFCRLTGKRRAAVISELVDDGEPVPGQALHRGSGMLRGGGCIAFAQKYGLKICTITDLAAYLDKTHPTGPFPGPQVDEV